ncbi:kazal-type serine protease inhibitor domain-containing protein 1-like [Acipenser oxyrinchus oxyrinchus]|uniref:Kazal-type serine protease inhibitor domain-containing protein 1-like n=1 Tax=Acipenser oxyrinchus oxyrinchus TaxID=40147 RepID=A0AAD8GJ81_ACIOX|nr:kazal-type serine protease inhibitor domain-containing protein 1-like [Acipenser oxyrinchus oxyrinchus]
MDCMLLIVLLLAVEATHSIPMERFQQLGWQRLLEDLEECSECQPELCNSPQRCPAGRVQDHCGCCWECSNAEGQLCDLDTSSNFYGMCGKDLECEIQDKDLNSGEIPEPQCVCTRQEVLCGSDGKTYENICKFREGQFRHRKKEELTVAHKGPCKTAPFIATPPRDIVNLEGSDVIFGCEVSSYPMAIVEWRKEGNSIFLPADDSHMAVQARGGPQRFELTGWLQIQRVQKEDEGMYTCCAKNEFGEVSASARLQVINPDSPLASKVKPFKTGVYDITDDEEDIEYGGSGYSY